MDVFISYRPCDIELQAHEIKKFLEESGISVWIAPDCIPAGENYLKAIPRAVDEAKIFLLLLSETVCASNYVLNELETAFKKSKVIIPFQLQKLREFTEDFDYLLTHTHIIVGDTVDNRVAVREQIQQRLNELDHKHVYANGDVYIGLLKDGKPWGIGTYYFKSNSSWQNDVYQGEFVNGKRHGQGQYRYASGKVYVGAFEEDYMHGEGEMRWPESDTRKYDRYEGEFKYNKRDGIGILYFTDGRRMEGIFKDNKLYTGKEYDKNDLVIREFKDGVEI